MCQLNGSEISAECVNVAIFVLFPPATLHNVADIIHLTLVHCSAANEMFRTVLLKVRACPQTKAGQSPVVDLTEALLNFWMPVGSLLSC